MTKLADIHSVAGERQRADVLFERSLAIRENALGAEHPDLTWTLRPWAGHLARAGEPERARQAIARALTIAEKAFGPEGLEVSYCLLAWSLIELGEGRYEQAGTLLQRSLAIQRKLYGPRHPVVGRSLYNLACVRSRQGNAEAALGHLREALDAGWAGPLILDDPDLDRLRGDPRFEALVAEVRARL